MKKINQIIYILLCIGISNDIFAQLNIKIKVNSVSVLNSLDCDAGATDNSDFVFEYKVQDNSIYSYANNFPVSGSIGLCNYTVINDQNGPFLFTPSSPSLAVFSPTNGIFFNRNYNCKNELPSSLVLIWRAYENDDSNSPSIIPIASGIIPTQINTTTISVLANGTYTAQFTQTSLDSNCPQTYSIVFEIQKTIGLFSPLVINSVNSSTICTGSSNGSLNSYVTGGSGSLMIDWSADGIGDFNDSLFVNNVAAGNYTLVVKDALNCLDTAYTTVYSVSPPNSISSFITSSSTVCAAQSGVIYSVASQPTGTIYHWSYIGNSVNASGNGSQISLNFNNTLGTGTLSVYAQNSCSITPTLTMTVEVLPRPSVTIIGNNTLCDNDQGSLSASGALNYLWNTGAITNTIVITPTLTLYSVVGTAFNGCSVSKNFSVNIIPSPTVQILGSSLSVCPNQSVSLLANGNGSLFIWSDGYFGSSHTVTALSTVIYTVTNTHTNSCYNQTTYTLNVAPGPTLSISGNTIVCQRFNAFLTASGADNYLWSNGITTHTNTFSVSTPTTITLIGTTINGCIDSLIQTINVVLPPVVTISGYDTICLGNSAILVANVINSVTSYNWNSGANTPTISVSPFSDFTYSVMVSNGYCSDTASHHIVVTSYPIINFRINSAPICNNDPVYTLTATPLGGVFSGPGVVNNTFNPSIGAGVYSITYSVSSGGNCTASKIQTIEVMLCTNINEISNSNELIVSPNPVLEDVIIKGRQVLNFIYVYDYLGNQKQAIIINSDEVRIDLQDLEKGIYLLEAVMKDNTRKKVRVIKL